MNRGAKLMAASWMAFSVAGCAWGASYSKDHGSPLCRYFRNSDGTAVTREAAEVS